MAQKRETADWSKELPDCTVIFTASEAGDEAAVRTWITEAIGIWNTEQIRRGHNHAAGPVPSSELPNVIKRSLIKGLCRACGHGHEGVVKIFLDIGVNPTAEECHDCRVFGKFYHSPFEATATTKHIEILKLLIDRGSTTNLGGQHYDRALRAAVRKTGRSHIAKLLIEHGANVNAMIGREDILASATYPHNEETVMVLINHGAKLQLRTVEPNIFLVLGEGQIHALDKAAEYGLEEMVRMLILADGDAQTRQVVYSIALYQAARKGHLTIARMLIQSAADMKLSINFPVVGKGQKGSLSCLTQASHCDHQEMVQLLLDNGADPNHADYEGETALLAAVTQNSVAIVRTLVENGARVNEHRITHSTDVPHDDLYVNEFGTLVPKLIYPASANELHIAVSKGYAEIVEILAQHGANVNAPENDQEYPLHVGVKHGHVGVVKVLLANSADVDAVAGSQGTAFDIAVKHCFQDVFKTLVEHRMNAFECGNDALINMMYMATEIGHKEVIKTLIRYGTDLNTRGGWYGTPLENACVLGHGTIVDVLLENGASPNIPGAYYGSALQAAAAHGHGNIVSALLRSGAAINATSGRYETALRAAVESGSEEVVALLVVAGADVNAFQSDSSNALLVASAHGLQNIVAILLEHGAEVNARGGWYGNALEAALACGHERTVDILLENGGQLINC